MGNNTNNIVHRYDARTYKHLDTSTIAEYSDEFELAGCTISNASCGRSATAGGFIWTKGSANHLTPIELKERHGNLVSKIKHKRRQLLESLDGSLYKIWERHSAMARRNKSKLYYSADQLNLWGTDNGYTEKWQEWVDYKYNPELKPTIVLCDPGLRMRLSNLEIKVGRTWRVKR